MEDWGKPGTAVAQLGTDVLCLVFEDVASADTFVAEANSAEGCAVTRTGDLEVELLGEANALRSIGSKVKGAASRVWKFLTKPIPGTGGGARKPKARPKPKPTAKPKAVKLPAPKPIPLKPAAGQPKPKARPQAKKPAVPPKAPAKGGRGPDKQPRRKRAPKPQPKRPATKPPAPKKAPKPPAAKKPGLLRRVGRAVRAVRQAPGKAKAAVTRTAKRVVSAPGRAAREFKAGLRGESTTEDWGKPGSKKPKVETSRAAIALPIAPPFALKPGQKRKRKKVPTRKGDIISSAPVEADWGKPGARLQEDVVVGAGMQYRTTVPEHPGFIITDAKGVDHFFYFKGEDHRDLTYDGCAGSMDNPAVVQAIARATNGEWVPGMLQEAISDEIKEALKRTIDNPRNEGALKKLLELAHASKLRVMWPDPVLGPDFTLEVVSVSGGRVTVKRGDGTEHRGVMMPYKWGALAVSENWGKPGAGLA